MRKKMYVMFCISIYVLYGFVFWDMVNADNSNVMDTVKICNCQLIVTNIAKKKEQNYIFTIQQNEDVDILMYKNKIKVMDTDKRFTEVSKGKSIKKQENVPNSPKLPDDLEALARYAAQETGLDYYVVVTHWVAEYGWEIDASNNFGGIRAGKNSFQRYDSPQEGVEAYIELIKSFEGIMATIEQQQKELEEQKKNWQKESEEQKKNWREDQLEAIKDSDWCTGNYNDGEYLWAVYKSVLKAYEQK